MSIDNDASIEVAPAAAQPPAPMLGAYLPDVPLAAIRPSPTNHRKTFIGLDELAESIRSKGVINPITVRPAPLALGTGKRSGKVDAAAYELIAGERRWRAAKLAGLETIPVILRPLSDVEVLELQLIENVQRQDVHPLEEADGYRDLLDHHGYTAEKIAAKTGKSAAYVYGRLKLCVLEEGVRAPFLEGKLLPSVALMIARIPSGALQARAAREVLGEFVDEDGSGVGVRRVIDLEDAEGNVTSEPVPMSVREAAAHIQRHYMLRLELAQFDPSSPTLLPDVGSCGACVHRTGNQPSLFGDVRGADVCTLPPCFERKTAAAWVLRADAARAAGRRVLEEAEAAKVFATHDGRTVSYGSAFVDQADKVPGDVSGNWAKEVTWERMLGKKGLAAVPTVIAQDGTGAARELLDRNAAVAFLREAGKIAAPPAAPAKGKKAGKDPKAEAKAFSDKVLRERAIVVFVREAGRASLELAEGGAPAKKSLAFWQWFAGETIARSQGGEFLAEATKTDPEAEPRDLVAKRSEAELRALAVQAMAADVADSMMYEDKESPALAEACKALGIEWRKVLLWATDEIAAELGAAAAAAPAKSKGPPPTDDGKRCGLVDGKGAGCIHDLGHDGLHSNGKRTWSDKKGASKR